MMKFYKSGLSKDFLRLVIFYHITASEFGFIYLFIYLLYFIYLFIFFFFLCDIDKLIQYRRNSSHSKLYGRYCYSLFLVGTFYRVYCSK